MPISTFLNGGTAAQLRGLQWLALSDTGNVGAGSVVSDGGGGGTVTWSYSLDVACRIDPVGDRSSAGQVVGGRIDERTTHVVTVPSGTDVQPASRFAIDGRGTFEVTAVRDRTAGWTQVFEVVEIS